MWVWLIKYKHNYSCGSRESSEASSSNISVDLEKLETTADKMKSTKMQTLGVYYFTHAYNANGATSLLQLLEKE